MVAPVCDGHCDAHRDPKSNMSTTVVAVCLRIDALTVQYQ